MNLERYTADTEGLEPLKRHLARLAVTDHARNAILATTSPEELVQVARRLGYTTRQLAWLLCQSGVLLS